MQPNFTILFLDNSVLVVHNIFVVLADLVLEVGYLDVVLDNLVIVVRNFSALVAVLTVGKLREMQLQCRIAIPIVGKLHEMQLHIWDMQLSIRSIQLSNSGYKT
jgi:hypothetical protein